MHIGRRRATTSASLRRGAGILYFPDVSAEAWMHQRSASRCTATGSTLSLHEAIVLQDLRCSGHRCVIRFLLHCARLMLRRRWMKDFASGPAVKSERRQDINISSWIVIAQLQHSAMLVSKGDMMTERVCPSSKPSRLLVDERAIQDGAPVVGATRWVRGPCVCRHGPLAGLLLLCSPHSISPSPLGIR